MKLHYCFLERFNNYFNRKIIRYESLLDYENNSKGVFIPEDSNGVMLPFDFNPNDNVTTEIIANEVPFDPDYFLLLDDDSNIVQRWFVLEQKRNRQGQWIYTLRRDVISDNLDNLEDAPIFVEKGMLPEDSPFIVNPEGMSLNQIKKNEIKLLDKSRSSWIIGYMAKNIGGSDINVQVSAEKLDLDYNTIGQIADSIGTTEGVLSSLLNFGDDSSNKAYFNTSFTMEITTQFTNLDGGISPYTPYYFTMNNDISAVVATKGTSGGSRPYLFSGVLGQNTNLVTDFIRQAIQNNGALLRSQIKDILHKSYLLTNDQLQRLYVYNGTYVKYNGEYYRLSITESGTHETTYNDIKNDGTFSSISAIANDTVTIAYNEGFRPFERHIYDPSSANPGKINRITANEKQVVISLKYLSSSDFIPQLNATISSGRNVTSDQEFDIFAIPLNLKISESGKMWETIENYARRMASAIGIQKDAKVYDIQLLPYCPIPDLVSGDNEINIEKLNEHEDFDYIHKNISDLKTVSIEGSEITYRWKTDHYECEVAASLPDVPTGVTPVIKDLEVLGFDGQSITEVTYAYLSNNVIISFWLTGENPPIKSVGFNYYYSQENVPCGIIFYVSRSSFSSVIDQEISIDKSRKVVSNCYMWRLVSPNYQGAFDFNIAKNGGKVSSFNVFCTYKPFTPVIKVAPNFEWLYGMEFQDNRGLVCAGDFSLPRASDAWESYQLQNKNYQNIFNRDIEHLDFMQSIEMRNQIISGAVGILGDAAKGAGAGAYVGGGWGALIGGIVGGGASALGYGIDIDTLARTQRENRQLAIDKFNYQLGNIKALPYTLTKVGSFDVISKIFPFVEEYSCSDEELEAFEKKIKYDSMTVMRIGTIREFANFNGEINYFKGQLIRNDEIAEDPHTLNAIYEELLKGVYI